MLEHEPQVAQFLQGLKLSREVRLITALADIEKERLQQPLSPELLLYAMTRNKEGLSALDRLQIFPPVLEDKTRRLLLDGTKGTGEESASNDESMFRKVMERASHAKDLLKDAEITADHIAYALILGANSVTAYLLGQENSSLAELKSRVRAKIQSRINQINPTGQDFLITQS